VSCAKKPESIEIPFCMWTGVGPRKRVDGGQLAQADEYDLNHPCLAAMRPFVNLLLLFIYLYIISYFLQ